MNKLITYIVSIAIVLFPLMSLSETITSDKFKSTCTDSFMKNASQASDPDAYKSYVNKMCECSGNLLNGKDVDQQGVMAGIGMCMRITLLTETMDNLSEEELTEDKITSTCVQEWKMFTSPNSTDQGTPTKACACAAKQIMALDKDKRTDEDSLKQIAMDCATKE